MAGVGSTGLSTAFGVTGSISCISAWETSVRGGETASCSRERSRRASESRATDGASSLRDRGQLESIERRTCAGHRVKVSVMWRSRAHPSSKLVVRGDLLTSTTATGDDHHSVRSVLRASRADRARVITSATEGGVNAPAANSSPPLRKHAHVRAFSVATKSFSSRYPPRCGYLECSSCVPPTRADPNARAPVTVPSRATRATVRAIRSRTRSPR